MPLLSGTRDWKAEFEFDPGHVFLNHAAFGPVTKRGRLAVESLMQRWGRLTPGADVDDETFAMLESAKSRFARLIDADPTRVAFAPNTSYGINAVLWGLNLQRGERILLPEVEFPALVYAVKGISRQLGLEFESLPCPNGFLTAGTLERALSRPASVLALSWVQYFNGYRYDLSEIVRICHEKRCFVLADGIQGVGAVPLDVHETGVDALACGAQKWLFGQTGSGFFYIAPNPIRSVEPLPSGWLGVDWGYRFGNLKNWEQREYEDGRRWEVGTYPFFSIRFAETGLAVLEECGKQQVWQNVQTLRERLASHLTDSAYRPVVFSDEGNRSGIMVLEGPRTSELHSQLREQHIHTALRENRIRVAPHFYNSEDDIDTLVHGIRQFEATL